MFLAIVLKFYMLIGDDKQMILLPFEKKKKKNQKISLSYGPLKIWAFKRMQDISKNCLAIAVKLYRLIRNEK